MAANTSPKLHESFNTDFASERLLNLFTDGALRCQTYDNTTWFRYLVSWPAKHAQPSGPSASGMYFFDLQRAGVSRLRSESCMPLHNEQRCVISRYHAPLVAITGHSTQWPREVLYLSVTFQQRTCMSLC